MAGETARLLGTLQAWAEETIGKAGSSTPAEGATCGWCPLCQALERVRTASPEVREHLSTGVTSLLHGAASLLEAVAEHQRSRDAADTDPAGS